MTGRNRKTQDVIMGRPRIGYSPETHFRTRNVLVKGPNVHEILARWEVTHHYIRMRKEMCRTDRKTLSQNMKATRKWQRTPKMIHRIHCILGVSSTDRRHVPSRMSSWLRRRVVLL
jgi:hypothetical protein